jgi:hypothetical protein
VIDFVNTVYRDMSGTHRRLNRFRRACHMHTCSVVSQTVVLA